MAPLLAIFIVFLVFAIGDMVSSFSKAYLSMALIAGLIFMVAFWCGLPITFFSDSGLLALNSITIGMLLVHMGSTIQLKTLLTDWKVLVISVVSCFGVAGGCYFIGRLFMDRYYALVAAPIAAGGTVSYWIMQATYQSLGRPDVETFAVLILVLQTLAGVPVASILCKKIGIQLKAQYRAGTLVTQSPAGAEMGQPGKKLIPPLPKKFQTGNVIFAKVALLSYIGSLISKATGVNALVFDLILGFVATEIGVLEEEALIDAGGFSLIMGTALVGVFSGLARSTLPMVASMIIPLIIVLVIGLVCMFVLGYVLAKILRFDWKMSVVVASTAYYGFINGYVVANEVAGSLGESDGEKKAILDYFLPKLLIGGVLSMFIVSALAATVMTSWF